ncbi:outer membrane protein [Sulfurovum sp. NBC37-1]|uniref:outer membrane protein n=1 Tax=Sulfurovum sp. (strain NBC37-1) TaxID=387093 RepID=UPI0001587DBE|nr:porin family protein [Sulfurovum sp. NBC37-1]BAF73392.1 hypothetical protein SUN_2458 [Sulfurovum sp. NBC37-1]
MKKIILNLTLLATISVADGNIVPVSTTTPSTEIAEENGIYVGLAFGNIFVNDDYTDEEISSNALVLQIGYQYNKYIAFEGRYNFGLNTSYKPGSTGNIIDDYNDDVSSWGTYIKPMYPIGNFTLYALLGYGGLMLKNLEKGDAYESAFQWGLGAKYNLSENLSLFADYIFLYNDTGFDYRAQLDDIDSDIWTLGVSYKF